MADIALAPSFVPTIRIRRHEWLRGLAHRADVQRRRARRNRYLALTGRSPQPYPWFAVMMQSISGR